MSSVAFDEVVGRLKMALDLDTDGELADALGIKQSTWAMRRKRGALPTAQIEGLIRAEELSPEYVYQGIGSLHLPVDDEQWKIVVHRKLRQVLEIQTYAKSLTAMGYKDKDLRALADGKRDISAELLRDLRRTVRVDLHALLCDELPVTPEEMAVVERYRRATLRGKRVIEAVAEFAAQPGDNVARIGSE